MFYHFAGQVFFMLILCWILSIVWSVFNIHDTSEVGCTSILSCLVATMLIDFLINFNKNILIFILFIDLVKFVQIISIKNILLNICKYNNQSTEDRSTANIRNRGYIKCCLRQYKMSNDIINRILL